MISPNYRLLVWVGALVVPLSTAVGIVPEARVIGAAILLLFFGIVLADAMLASGEFDGIRLKMPDVVRMSTSRSGVIPLLIEIDKGKQRLLRFGLPLPQEITAVNECAVTQLPASGGSFHLEYPCVAVRRGCYRLKHCYMQQNSRFSFWSVRRAFPVQSELRVYPDLLHERKAVAALFLNRGRFGIHAQRQVGQGRDFEKLREYLPGDSLDEIHWKATAKRGKPVTKVFQIERTQEVYVVIDASRLCARTAADSEAQADSKNPLRRCSAAPTVLDRFITSALLLGIAAERQGDLFGLIAFSDRVHRFVRAKSGRQHFGACRDALYTMQPDIVSPDFEELCSFIRVRLRKRALLVFLTDLDDPMLSESFARNVELVSRQHLVVVNMLRPAAVAPLFGNELPNTSDDIYRHLSGHMRWQDMQELSRVLSRSGAPLSLLENEKLAASLITAYVTIKQRQML